MITVPTNQPTIQAGIEAAADGDTVSVLPGVYAENINFLGKAVRVIAAGAVTDVVLEPAAATAPIVSADSGEGAGAAIKGFTIRNGAGGGVAVANGAHMAIAGNIFSGFTGGAAVLEFSRGSGSTKVCITRNIFTGNSNWACMYGWLDTDSVVILNNTLWQNTGGVVLMDLSPAVSVVKGNIVANCCDVHGEGAFRSWYVYNDQWNGEPQCGRIEYDGGLNGCFDPRFIDPSAGDFRLREESPCIDAGDPSAVYRDPDGSPNDMGAIPYTGTDYPVPLGLSFGTGRFNNVTPTVTPMFCWSYFDTALTSQAQWQVQVSSDSTWAAVDLWDPGPSFSADTSAVYAGADLRPYRKYYVRVRVGNGGAWGDWRYSAFSPVSDYIFLVPED